MAGSSIERYVLIRVSAPPRKMTTIVISINAHNLGATERPKTSPKVPAGWPAEQSSGMFECDIYTCLLLKNDYNSN